LILGRDLIISVIQSTILKKLKKIKKKIRRRRRRKKKEEKNIRLHSRLSKNLQLKHTWIPLSHKALVIA
jgi:hypothetical protein